MTDIPINNCKLLTIECNADRYDQDLILYDAVEYKLKGYMCLTEDIITKMLRKNVSFDVKEN